MKRGCHGVLVWRIKSNGQETPAVHIPDRTLRGREDFNQNLRWPVGIAFGFFLDEQIGLLAIFGSVLVALGVIVMLSPVDWFAWAKNRVFDAYKAQGNLLQ